MCAIDKELAEDYAAYEIELKGKKMRVGMIRKKTTSYDAYNDSDYFEKAIIALLGASRDDIIIAPEYDFLPKAGPMSRKEKDRRLKKLKEASKGKDILLFAGSFIWIDKNGKMHNTAPVIYDGDVLLEYDKRRDGGEWSIAERHKLKAVYGEKPGLFEWKGFSFGVEICADHGMLKERNEARDLDFHVLVSCGRTLDENSDIVAREGGYALGCDGYNPRTDVLKVSTNGKKTKISETR